VGKLTYSSVRRWEMKFKGKRLVVLGAVIAAAVAVAVPVALAVTFGGTLSVTDPKQHDRLVRDDVPSTCHGKANPGLIGDGHIRPYDKYRLTNHGGAQCVHVFLQHNCNPFNAFSQANSTFIPTNPSLHYLGDAGQSASPQSYSFPVHGGQSFDVVVAEVDGGQHALPCPYRLTVTIGGQQTFVASSGSGGTD
jgi:hypothetical protein